MVTFKGAWEVYLRAKALNLIRFHSRHDRRGRLLFLASCRVESDAFNRAMKLRTREDGA